jgi:hypothetical protein
MALLTTCIGTVLLGHGGGAELACTAMNIVLMNFGFLVRCEGLHTVHLEICQPCFSCLLKYLSYHVCEFDL